MSHVFQCATVAIQRDATKRAEGSQVVKPSHMVVMLMGEQHAINFLKRKWHQLLAYVRATINQQSGIFSFHHRHTTQAVVARVGATTHLTVTAY